MKPIVTCYMCGAPKTSREHAPPECLFPEEKEFGQNLRLNLITVPSCDDHNSKKSEDDEYLRAVILFTAVKTSKIAQHQFLGKMIRSVRRAPSKYSKLFTDQGTLASGALHAMRIDRPRFDQCIGHLARAIFFNHHQAKWPHPVMAVSPNFYSSIENDQAVAHQPSVETVRVSQMYLQSESIRGENPQVFKYRIRYDAKEESFAFCAQFYEFFEVYCYSSRAAANAIA
jgi:hypothetical protein